ncbi:GNAT family N-acetyltransferase [Actinomadura kijaniata]|uniref:GNAT family N-acetyltransferase n=1 Tax=Actinomadura kijaniata TaxID=46161 RepID=UPI003F1B144F
MVENPKLSRFEIFAEDELAGFAEYQAFSSGLAFVHTEIDQRFAGHGLGGRLVQGALDTARQRGVKVLPFCPFFSGWIAKHPEYLDLVTPDRRERFGL